MTDWPKAVLHVDADAFFASVEEVLDPNLKGKPVIVGGPAGSRGVVSSANYVARKYGVKSAMSMKEALRRCSGAKVAFSGFGYYSDFSRRMFEVCRRFTPTVEITSIDEGYLDLKGTELMHGLPVREISKAILSAIHKEVKISASGGLGTNKTIAKIASGLNKPHSLTTVLPGKERAFLAPLPLREMPGIGPKTSLFLGNLGISTLGDLARMPFEDVYRLLGLNGISLWRRAQGIDESEVLERSEAQKSISKETTFARDKGDRKDLTRTLKSLCNQVLFSLRQQKSKAHLVHLKIRYENFQTFSYSHKLPGPMDSDFEIFPLAKKLLLSKLKERRNVRLLGFGVADLRTNYNLSIFQNRDQKEQRIVWLGDLLRKKYGIKVLEYGVE